MSNEKPNHEAILIAKHDIKNQLSSITLALEQLKWEVSDENPDIQLYIEMIENSCKSINDTLKIII
jgi:hypothetical protein